jgi:hypothetical protein
MRANIRRPLFAAACLLAFTRCQCIPHVESIVLDEVAGSGVSGKAMISYEGDEILLEVTGRPDWTNSLVGHVHQGQCGNLTTIVLTLEYEMTHTPTERFLEGGYAIDLHQKTDPNGPSLACGNL